VKLKWSLVADIELLKLVTYVHPRNRNAALKLHRRTRERVRQLEKFAFSGRTGRMPGTRELVIGKSPYIAVYTVEADIVIVHHVFHTSQQWPPEDE
jgi:addiction module RelE/StbE family toxin